MNKEPVTYIPKGTYTFAECCKVLNVDFKTFKKWLEKDEIQAHDSTYDARIKFLSADQVQALASRHGRPWPPVQQEPELITATMAKRLLEQVAIATQQAQELEKQLKKLLDHDEIIKANSSSVEALQRDLARSSQEQLKDQDLLREHGRMLGSLTETLTKLRERYQHAADERERLEEELKLERARIDTLTAASQEQQPQLTQLAARVGKHGQRLAQISARIDEIEQKTLARISEIETQAQESLLHLQANLQAEFQASFQALQTQYTRDVAMLTQLIDQAAKQAEAAQITAHQAQRQAQEAEQAATTALDAGQRQLESINQRIAEGETRLQLLTLANESLTQRIEHIQAPEPPAKPRRRSPRKSQG